MKEGRPPCSASERHIHKNQQNFLLPILTASPLWCTIRLTTALSPTPLHFPKEPLPEREWGERNTVVCSIVHGAVGETPVEVWLQPTPEAKAKCCARLFSRSGAPAEEGHVKVNAVVRAG